MKKALLLALVLFAFFATSVQAVSIPDFPSCTSPSGAIKVSYATGIHGIPGDSGQYQGSDTVYTVSDTQLLQCFCAASGSGIQTTWWKVNSLDQTQINQLTNAGWIFIPDGSAWGLEATPYYAKNSSYSCGQTSGGFSQSQPGPAPECHAGKPPTPTLLSVVRSGRTATLTWSAVEPATHYTIAYGTTPGNYPFGVPNTGRVISFTVGALDPNLTYYFVVRAVNDCMPGDFSSFSPFGGQILGLATTGNLPIIMFFAGLGLLLLVLSLLVRKFHREA